MQFSFDLLAFFETDAILFVLDRGYAYFEELRNAEVQRRRIHLARTRVNSVAGWVIHRGQVECTAGGGVCAVFGSNPHAGATVVNGPGGGPNPRPSFRRYTSSRKVDEQRARCAGKE